MSQTVDTGAPTQLDVLDAIQRRVLWLAVRMVDYANRERPTPDELKVGGHQASSASMVTLMTALYFASLKAEDRVSVKPHASPVLHAIEYLMGRLDRSYLTTLRELGGLQSYPSRTKDPFPVDYSTGSVGLGSAAPLFGALVDRYVEAHFGTGTGGRFISLLGDAELDEGNIWEAVIEPETRTLGNALWIVDLNRQSLDRVVPLIKAIELEKQLEIAGWRVIELKYGRRLREAYAREGGDLLRRAIDEMPNQRYQSLFGASEEVIVEAVLDGFHGADRARLQALLDGYRGQVAPLVQDLGGHDLGDVLEALAAADAADGRPTAIFAYTIKGWGLPIAGHPLNHSALLSGAQVDELRTAHGLTPDTEWDRFPDGSLEAAACAMARARLERSAPRERATIAVPATISTGPYGRTSTQAALGRLLVDLARSEEVAKRIVTVSPDVSVSTNLGGWINRVGVWSANEQPTVDAPADSPLAWRISPEGRHIELGISEMNLCLLIGQLGMARELQGEQLFPIGTLYDPFVVRGLEGVLYSTYSGARFVLAGTPSGVSLSREGGAHQSTITPGIGMELPGLVYAEPCFALELEWLLLDALARMQEPDGEALYLRLSTKPIGQEPLQALVDARGVEAVRAEVLRGGFRIREAGSSDDRVVLAACGAILPEVLEAAERLADEEGVEASVVCLSSPDRLYRDWRDARLRPLETGGAPAASHLESLVLETERALPLVTVIDGASHALAFLGSCLGMRTVPLGVDRFGQAGSQPAVYDAYGISPDAIVTAALVALA